MKKLFFLSAILCGVILCSLIFGSFKNDVGFYHSPFFLLLWICAAGITFTCLFSRRKVSIDSWLIHSGLLVILAGALVSFLFSYRQVLEIKEGEKQELTGTGLVVRLDDFNLQFYAGGQTPKEFRSNLSVFSNNRLIKMGKCLVNHPFSCQGFKFYQQSYAPAEVSLKVVAGKNEFVFREIGDEVLEPESGLTLKMIDFLPDFVLGSSRKAFSRSEEFNNPAVKIVAYKGKEQKDTGWLFLKYKEFHPHSGKILAHFRFEKIVTDKYQSSLEVVKDPGAIIVFLGAIILLVGFIRRFSN